jgi:hypothetical protein
MRQLTPMLFLFVCGSCHAEKRDAVAPIPVVHSWSDLLATRALKVKDDNFVGPPGTPTDFDILPAPSFGAGGSANSFGEPGLKLTGINARPPNLQRVWIGIDRDHTTSKSGVVIYCASQGIAFARSSSADLGPFLVVVRPSPSTRLAKFSDKPLLPSHFDKSTYVLASHSVVLDEPGDYVIELQQRAPISVGVTPPILARTTIHVAGAPAQAWLPWDEPPTPAPAAPPAFLAAPTPGDEVVDTTVSNPLTCFAIPKASTDARFYPAQLVPYVSLPQLIPNAGNEGAHLSVDGNALLLEARDLCWPQPKERCLTRWWINDKPFTPAKDSADFDRVYQGANGHSPDDLPSAIRFHLIFQPGRLGAKQGDKIGVQILYCPSGVDRCANPSAELYNPVFRAPEVPPENFSSLSNRIDFIYSGDPANPVAQ